MRTTYDDTMTMREARKAYFEANGFGESGGYDDAWVDFKLGPLPMPFPNTPARVRAVRYHDLHHILTGYRTDTLGEFEISAWEIGAGCKDFAAAWVLNLGGMTAGMFRAPKRIFRAFVRGRRDRSIYGEELEAVLDATVGEARARFMRPEDGAGAGDVLLFTVTLLAGLVVGLATFAIVVPLVPFGLVALNLRRRADAARAG